MRVLIVDTALGACTAAVVEGGRLLGLRTELMTKGHQERLAGMTRDAVADAGGGFGALDRIGVTVGPGSFTGLRVGLAFAQGLGAALARPVVGVSTLDALAGSVEAGGLVAAVIDARRGQVYARLFRDGIALGAAEALPLDVAVERILEAGAAPTLVGSGAVLLSETFPDRLGKAVSEPLAAPTSEALARLTAAADRANAPPRPLYLRAPDATPPSRLPGQPRPPAS
ncbi:tRNA threonylcarbamoyladenosine biosynthesis protein TsaB [Brevundimonas bullata]|uniref:tRNA threonylcarbamoyladenosine biosynthesis protein TsaB n=1 Tax=Brevundimonas bullata TaxID=13160 RepID=A0A7W7IMR0_9CAUL|nr:tRNA (adenosine(37)-N6)-threonylcarbamoyltransferase complex dimerization subunit type 1 TsaB [Brevundimonas bullata]MBB4796978.1 tRNA threonylcarbamoyladenosine biosynthesis protein TsaB [Brevundimonas bullata]MBB6381937.1 tRNA threonylcarbamoyladenosine biosynthesis protein TsaB [Brevundimonas bullata]